MALELQHLVSGLAPSVVAIILATVYLSGLVIYRLYLHPLAGFPGPKLAGVTSWYEAYYEIACHGQYSRKITQLHHEYGMLLFHVPPDRT